MNRLSLLIVPAATLAAVLALASGCTQAAPSGYDPDSEPQSAQPSDGTASGSAEENGSSTETPGSADQWGSGAPWSITDCPSATVVNSAIGEKVSFEPLQGAQNLTCFYMRSSDEPAAMIMDTPGSTATTTTKLTPMSGQEWPKITHVEGLGSYAVELRDGSTGAALCSYQVPTKTDSTLIVQVTRQGTGLNQVCTLARTLLETAATR